MITGVRLLSDGKTGPDLQEYNYYVGDSKEYLASDARWTRAWGCGDQKKTASSFQLQNELSNTNKNSKRNSITHLLTTSFPISQQTRTGNIMHH